jgi:hypothetical protein
MRAVASFLARDWGVQRVDAVPDHPPPRHPPQRRDDRPAGALRRVRLLLTSLVVL